MEVYGVSFRNYLAATGTAEEDLVADFGITAEEMHRRCLDGVTREAWAALGRTAKLKNVLFARRECLTCFRDQFVIPLTSF
jgi:hypothetical protein